MQGFSELVNKLSMPWTRSLYNAVGFTDGGAIRGSDARKHERVLVAISHGDGHEESSDDLVSHCFGLKDFTIREGYRRAEEERRFFEQ